MHRAAQIVKAVLLVDQGLEMVREAISAEDMLALIEPPASQLMLLALLLVVGRLDPFQDVDALELDGHHHL